MLSNRTAETAKAKYCFRRFCSFSILLNSSSLLLLSIHRNLLAIRVHGAFPGLITDILAVVNRFLPSGEGAGTVRYTSKESETPITQSFLTTLGKQASQQYNEDASTTPS